MKPDPPARIDAECPTCGARRGENCITRGGNVLGVNQQHTERPKMSSEQGEWREKYDRLHRELPQDQQFTAGRDVKRKKAA